MKSETVNILGGLLFLAIGLGLLFLSWNMYRATADLTNRLVPVRGVIKGISNVAGESDDFLAVDIVVDGERRTVGPIRQEVTFESYEIGDGVDIFYDAENPIQAYLTRQEARNIIPLLLFPFAAIVTFMGAGTILVNLRRMF